MLDMHDLSVVHKEAMIAWINYKQSRIEGSVVSRSTSSEVIALNRHYIKTIADILLFCATHDLPLRGHNESDDVTHKGVFLDLVDFMARHDQEFQRKLDNIPKNATSKP